MDPLNLGLVDRRILGMARPSLANCWLIGVSPPSSQKSCYVPPATLAFSEISPINSGYQVQVQVPDLFTNLQAHARHWHAGDLRDVSNSLLDRIQSTKNYLLSKSDG